MVNVSSYEEVFRDAFDKAFGELPEQYPDLVKQVCDKIYEAVVERVRDDVRDYLAENIKDDLCRKAAEMAESMLMNALAGDDKEIRNLFGFSDWYMRHLYLGQLPTQWALIDAITDRRPDIFLDERIKQREAEILNLKNENQRIRQLAEHWQNKANEGGSDA